MEISNHPEEKGGMHNEDVRADIAADSKTGKQIKSIEIVHETRTSKNADETIEQTKTKNGDAASEAQEGDFGERSYASPDFGKS